MLKYIIVRKFTFLLYSWAISRFKRRTSGLGVDLQPQPFTLDDYSNPDGLVKEILDTGIELKVA